jgi:hypothetical protein
MVLSYWHKTKCHSSLDSALHKIAWYDLESLATKKPNPVNFEARNTFGYPEINFGTEEVSFSIGVKFCNRK